MITQEHMKNYVLDNPTLVNMNETSLDNVFVLKYKNKVFFDNLWTDELVECRGTLVDKDFNVLARPFTKIYNQFEQDTDIALDEQVTAFRKINGFMAAISVINDEIIVSTTGTIDSEFAVLAYKRIIDLGEVALTSIKENLRAQDDHPGMTMICEICDESDPHIIEEESGVYFLGVRKNSWSASANLIVTTNMTESNYKNMCELYGMRACEMYNTSFENILEMNKTVLHEGFVVYGKHVTLKLKSPHYKITKFLGRKYLKKPEKMIEMLDSAYEIKKTVDEEFYDLIDNICLNRDKFVAMKEQDRIAYIREFLS